ncbi:MAG: glycosyltransferase family 4 protein [Deltaproteobacteria bacterium]|nr:glycosyltransferase family 4 protein [Deltaproteobacteria bacterium]
MNSMQSRAYPILYLHHTGRFAGAENSLLHLATHLDRSRFSPLFLCPSVGEFPDRLASRGVPVIHHEFGSNSQPLRLVQSLAKIRRVIRERQIALLHANGPQTNVPAGIVGRLLGVPVVWHARNCLRPGMVDIDRMTGFLPDRIICNSDAIRSRFLGGLTEKKSLTILNSVDLADFDPEFRGPSLRQELGIPVASKVLGMTSRLSREKGQQTLLEAVALLKGRFPDLYVLLVGDSIFTEDEDVPRSLREMADRLGISERVLFTGFRRDVPRLYGAMDIFILATDAEPCGRVLFEAMAMARPVIGTDNGGTPEIVVDGVTGLLFPYGDAATLSERITRLLEQPAEMARMGAAGRRRVEEHFTIDRYMEKTQRVYLELLEGDRAPRR